MTENKLIIFSLVFALSIIAGAVVFAQESAPITFPIKELGNCRNFRECANFCDKAQNIKVCTKFGMANGIVMPEEAEATTRMTDSIVQGGPGGCKSQEECGSYCQDLNNIEECVNFAEKAGFMKPEEVKEARMAAAAIKKGAKPPGNCTSKEQCDAYCDNEANIEECIAFAEVAGFIKPEEAKMIKKTGGKGPGGCRGKEQCDTYCQSSENMEVCMNFAIEHDLMPPEEREDALKMLTAIKKGVRPPNCRSRAECDKYCSQPEHAEECTEFAIAAGFIPPEEAENIRRMAKAGIIGGPGGCRGKDACESYCNDLSHMTECVDFAEKAGFMKPEDAARARRMAEKGINVMNGGPGGCKSQEECESFCNNPDNAETCMNFAVQAGEMSPEEAERAKQGTRMMQQGGPGGCKGEEECKSFCDKTENQAECFRFVKENNLMPQEELQQMERGAQMMQQGGPGGCRGSQECESYCGDHGDECSKWLQEGGLMPVPQAGENRMMPPQEIMLPREGMPPGEMRPPEGGWPEGQQPPEGWPASPSQSGQEMFPEGMMPQREMMPQQQYVPQEGMQEGGQPIPGEFLPPQENSEYMLPGDQVPTGEIRQEPIPQIQPQEQQIFVPPPAEYTAPPTTETAPPPAETTPPPVIEQPTSFIDSFLGLIFYPIVLIFQ